MQGVRIGLDCVGVGVGVGGKEYGRYGGERKGGCWLVDI